MPAESVDVLHGRELSKHLKTNVCVCCHAMVWSGILRLPLVQYKKRSIPPFRYHNLIGIGDLLAWNELSIFKKSVHKRNAHPVIKQFNSIAVLCHSKRIPPLPLHIFRLSVRVSYIFLRHFFPHFQLKKQLWIHIKFYFWVTIYFEICLMKWILMQKGLTLTLEQLLLYISQCLLALIPEGIFNYPSFMFHE